MGCSPVRALVCELWWFRIVRAGTYAFKAWAGIAGGAMNSTTKTYPAKALVSTYGVGACCGSAVWWITGSPFSGMGAGTLAAGALFALLVWQHATVRKWAAPLVVYGTGLLIAGTLPTEGAARPATAIAGLCLAFVAAVACAANDVRHGRTDFGPRRRSFG